jgi:hypothetical protein
MDILSPASRWKNKILQWFAARWAAITSPQGQRYDRPWYDLYGADKPVIVGHFNYTGTEQPFIYQDKVYGLDTDCVTGKVLTGILLPSFQFVSGPSRGNLWMQVRRSYQTPKARPSMPRASIAAAWIEEQNQELTLLFQKLPEVNSRFRSQVQDIPGYIDLKPRQQSRLYSELVARPCWDTWIV